MDEEEVEEYETGYILAAIDHRERFLRSEDICSAYRLTRNHTKRIDTDKAFEGEPLQIRPRIVAREFKSDDGPDLYAGTPPLEALKSTISIAASHKETFSIMHIDVPSAYFHGKAQRPVWWRTEWAQMLEIFGLL